MPVAPVFVKSFIREARTSVVLPWKFIELQTLHLAHLETKIIRTPKNELSDTSPHDEAL